MRKKTRYVVLTLTVVIFGWTLAYENRASSWWPWVSHDQWTMIEYDTEATFASPNWGPRTMNEEAWNQSVDGDVIGAPVLWQSQVIVSTDDGALQGLDRWSGNVGWTYNVNGSISRTAIPTVSNGTLYTATNEELVAVDPVRGEREWTSEYPEGVENPFVAPRGDEIFVIDQDQLVAFDAQSGDTIWGYPAGFQSRTYFNPIPTRSDDEIVLSVENGYEQQGPYTERINHQVIGLDASQGDTTMIISLPFAEGSVSQPVLRGDTVYMRANSDILAIDTESDTIAWSREVDGSLSRSISLKNGNIYSVTYNGTVYSLNLDSRDIRWETDLDGSIPRGTGPMVAGEGLYLTVDSDQVVRLDRDSGNVTDRFDVQGSTQGSLIVGNNHVYVAGADETVRALTN